MAATDFDYIDYANAAGQVRKLPVAKGTPCSARPAPSSLTTAQIATMVADLPPAPSGYSWRRKNCIIAADGPWVIDNDNPPSFIADQTGGTGPTTVDPADRSPWTNLGITKTDLL